MMFLRKPYNDKSIVYQHMYPCVSLTGPKTLHSSYSANNRHIRNTLYRRGFILMLCYFCPIFNKNDSCSCSCIKCFYRIVIQYPTRHFIIPSCLDIICNINASAFPSLRNFAFVVSWYLLYLNTLRPRWNGRHFPDDIYKCIFVTENAWISLRI